MSLLSKLRSLWGLEKEVARLEIEELKLDLARLTADGERSEEARLQCETEKRELQALRKHDRSQLAQLRSEVKHHKAASANWEQSYRDAVQKLNEQALLNAEFLQQFFYVELDAKAHSGLVDSQKVQVLTQMTVRKLRISKGLLGALHDAFSLNVARHLIKKLGEHGALEHRPMSAEEYHQLSQLPPGPPREDPKLLREAQS